MHYALAGPNGLFQKLLLLQQQLRFHELVALLLTKVNPTSDQGSWTPVLLPTAALGS